MGDDLISPELQRYSMEQWAERNNVDIVEFIEDLDKAAT